MRSLPVLLTGNVNWCNHRAISENFFQASSACSCFSIVEILFPQFPCCINQLHILVGLFFCTYNRYFLMSMKSHPEHSGYWLCFLVDHFPVVMFGSCFCFAVDIVQGTRLFSLKTFSAALLSEVKVAQACPSLCDPMDYTVQGILQARMMRGQPFPSPGGSSQPRDRTRISLIADRFFTS